MTAPEEVAGGDGRSLLYRYAGTAAEAVRLAGEVLGDLAKAGSG